MNLHKSSQFFAKLSQIRLKPNLLQPGPLHSSEGLFVDWDIFTPFLLWFHSEECVRDGSYQSSIWTKTLFGKKRGKKSWCLLTGGGVQREEVTLGAYAGWDAAFLTLIWAKLAMCEQFGLPRLHAGWEQDAINGAPHRWGCKRIHAQKARNNHLPPKAEAASQKNREDKITEKICFYCKKIPINQIFFRTVYTTHKEPFWSLIPQLTGGKSRITFNTWY